MKFKKLNLSFFCRDAEVVAKELIGKIIKKGDFKGVICETEAYKGEEDKASHASNGKTNRNKPMFERGGFSYVYFIYGMYFCFNITTGKKLQAGAVLIRGVIPKEGIDKMKSLRKYKQNNLKNLTNGPGKFCQAFDINKSHNHLDLLQENSPIQIFEPKEKFEGKIKQTSRIGIKDAKDKMWRFIF